MFPQSHLHLLSTWLNNLWVPVQISTALFWLHSLFPHSALWDLITLSSHNSQSVPPGVVLWAWALLGSSVLCCYLQSLSGHKLWPQWAIVNHSIYFLLIRNCFPLLPDLPCFVKTFFIYIVQVFSYFIGKVNLVFFLHLGLSGSLVFTFKLLLPIYICLNHSCWKLLQGRTQGLMILYIL